MWGRGREQKQKSGQCSNKHLQKNDGNGNTAEGPWSIRNNSRGEELGKASGAQREYDKQKSVQHKKQKIVLEQRAPEETCPKRSCASQIRHLQRFLSEATAKRPSDRSER